MGINDIKSWVFALLSDTHQHFGFGVNCCGVNHDSKYVRKSFYQNPKTGFLFFIEISYIHHSFIYWFIKSYTYPLIIHYSPIFLNLNFQGWNIPSINHPFINYVFKHLCIIYFIINLKFRFYSIIILFSWTFLHFFPSLFHPFIQSFNRLFPLSLIIYSLIPWSTHSLFIQQIPSPINWFIFHYIMYQIIRYSSFIY